MTCHIDYALGISAVERVLKLIIFAYNSVVYKRVYSATIYIFAKNAPFRTLFRRKVNSENLLFGVSSRIIFFLNLASKKYCETSCLGIALFMHYSNTKHSKNNVQSIEDIQTKIFYTVLMVEYIFSIT